MKFKVCHDPVNKALSIPRAALQLSGLAGANDLVLHAEDGCILLMPEQPITEELLKTIRLLSTVTPQLISRLAALSMEAMEREMKETECGDCGYEPDCSGLSIPPCQLMEAGIDPKAPLESFTENGRIIVQTAEKTAADELIESLSRDLRAAMEEAGVQMGGVFRLLEDEGYRDE